jgi:alkylation response protein AidB-like acyl-CoA dehydrogenase
MDALLRDRLAWPFFEHRHLALVKAVEGWTATDPVPHMADTDAACRAWVRALGAAGWLKHCVPASWGGASDDIESRSLTLLRECLAAHDGLADFAIAMQGLGSGAISLEGSEALRKAWLPRVASGDAIAAFALTEPEAGSDVGAMACRAERVGDGYELTGEKTWISNGGIADFYTVFARTDASSKGAKGISAFVVPADAPGLSITERMEVIAPHPLARLRFDKCRVPASHRLGDEGSGFKLAMRTLDIFRVTVAGAALGFARRALSEALAHANARAMFGTTLAQQPLAQATLGDMATDFDAAALLTYRAAWRRDTTGARGTREAAMAKLVATEHAQTIIDRAVQLHGGRGVQHGVMVERLYREIRALRIYEGASEVQRLIIGRETVAAAAPREG